MNMADHIASDVECMRDYFTRLLAFAKASSRTPSPDRAGGPQLLPFGIACFVRPDMACNVYSLVDFWLARLCLYHQPRGHLSPSFEDFKKDKRKRGRNDLQTYVKYLTKVARLDLSAEQPSFRHIDDLRVVRNVFMHAGGHVHLLPDRMRERIERMPGVSLEMKLVVVPDQFIWQSLDHASQYLQAIARA
jgi:hypothetical protein